MIQQSPFMPLTTALFEAVADLNHHNIFPNKDTLHEYLRKHYPEIKTPDTRIIHDCLGRLIKNRRLYHNGRGYFILFSENILNDVISLKSETSLAKTTKQQHHQLDATSLEPSIIGFKVVDSRTSSSGQTDAHTTDLPTDCTENNRTSSAENQGIVFKRHNSYDTLTEVTALADGVANISELYTPKLPRASLSSKIFRGRKNSNNNNSSNSKSLSTPSTPNENAKSNNHKSRFFCGTATDSIILSNDLIDSPSRRVVTTKTTTPITIANNDVLDSAAMSDTTDVQSSSTKTGRRSRKIKRSKTFNNRTKNMKEVSFALIGSPKDDSASSEDDDDEEDHQSKRFQRSHSFGVGYRKDKYQRPLISDQRTTTATANTIGWKNLHRTKTISLSNSSSNENSNNTTLVDGHHQQRQSSNLDTGEEDTTYDDIETSFVDDSLPVFLDHDPDDIGDHSMSSKSHTPDMCPVVETYSVDMLEKYKDLGSALSLPRANDKSVNFDVVNLLSPTKEESLAEELKQASSNSVSRTRSSPAPAVTADKNNPRRVSIDLMPLKQTGITSPSRSRRKQQGTPNESKYITDVLDQTQQLCQALEDSKKDGSTTSKNSNNVVVTRRVSKSRDTNNDNNNNKTQEASSSSTAKAVTTVKGVKMRNRPKSTEEERKRSQKERNSLLFEEKRASLKVMGLV